MSIEVLPTQDDQEHQAEVLEFPVQRINTHNHERKTRPNYAKTYLDLAKLAFANGDIDTGEQYRQMAELFQL